MKETSALLTRYLETGILPDDEGSQLLAAMDELIEKNELALLAGLRYQYKGEEQILTVADLEVHYWEIFMYYTDSEEHDDHHHHEAAEDEGNHLTRWWWVYFILAAIGIFAIWKLTQGHP
ncbi:hypothetical protein [Chitinophaga rhizophila]|uniref:Uncharacterized protein n=1 Tax=Chitinophaga rhizophila TaxID=2866212 RepID=A0ABS7GKH4_9BACT|nr:hypothetical protein [Chitinophaga rhizophila]MBW8687781.1 hypothetical protein [Chitinophaga rhizophila]